MDVLNLKLEENVPFPDYKSEGASGFDITAFKILKAYKGEYEVNNEKLNKIQKGFETSGYIRLRPFERILFGSGISVSHLDRGFELQIRSRSGLSLKKGLIVINQPGTIDSDYRGEIGIILYNSTPFLSRVERDERLAQVVVTSVITPKLVHSEEISSTERGDKGFGSTGEK